MYNHIKEVSPNLAAELLASHKLPQSSVKLQEVVDFYYMKNSNQIKITVKKNPDVKKMNVQVGCRRIRFTPQEDEIIRSAMNEAEASDQTVDLNALGRKIKRSSKCVYNRIAKLCRIQPLIKNNPFSLVEDQCILETLVVPRLASEKLSEVYFRQNDSDVCDLSKQWNRGTTSVRNRWLNILQPMLLQHYSGTLNLRVERMLVNRISENCTDFNQIDWTDVAARSEFAGHTERSLRHMYFSISKQTRTRLQKRELSPQNIAQFCEEVYGEGGGKLTVSSIKLQRQREVIAFFINTVIVHNLVDFL